MDNKLNEIQLDALKEVVNIGAGHAAIAFSQLLSRKIMIAVIRTDIVPSEVFLENIIEGADSQFVSVYLETLGDIQGVVIFMFSKKSALKLSDMLLFRDKENSKFVDEKAQSAMKETGGILTGAFFSVLADSFNLNIFHKSPCYAYDNAETIMYAVCDRIFGDHKQRLCLATSFIESTSQITGSFVFVPTEKAMVTILRKLKV